MVLVEISIYRSAVLVDKFRFVTVYSGFCAHLFRFCFGSKWQVCFKPSYSDLTVSLKYPVDRVNQTLPSLSLLSDGQDSDTASLQHRLENLLDLAYRMQDRYERLCERDVEHIALESALSVFADREGRADKSFDDDSSDQESYVSCSDVMSCRLWRVYS